MKKLSERLTAYQKYKHDPHYPKCLRHYTEFAQQPWRAGRGNWRVTGKVIGLGPDVFWSDEDKGIVHCDQVTFARFVEEAHKIIRLNHTGWYADNHQDMLFIGEVYQLTGVNGQPRYLAAYRNDESGCVTVDVGESFSEKVWAARAADSLAQHEAEKSRDFYAKDQAEQDIAEAKEEIHRINTEALALIREVKGNRYTPAVCSAIKGQLAEFLAERRDQFRLIEKRRADYWSAVPGVC